MPIALFKSPFTPSLWFQLCPRASLRLTSVASLFFITALQSTTFLHCCRILLFLIKSMSYFSLRLVSYSTSPLLPYTKPCSTQCTLQCTLVHCIEPGYPRVRCNVCVPSSSLWRVVSNSANFSLAPS